MEVDNVSVYKARIKKPEQMLWFILNLMVLSV